VVAGSSRRARHAARWWAPESISTPSISKITPSTLTARRARGSPRPAGPQPRDGLWLARPYRRSRRARSPRGGHPAGGHRSLYRGTRARKVSRAAARYCASVQCAASAAGTARPMTSWPSRVRVSSSPRWASASGAKSASGAAGSSSCSFLNHARVLTRRRTGARLWPSVSSFGRTRLRISSMRVRKPCTSNTLKSPATNAPNGIGVLLGSELVERVDRPAHALEGETRQVRRREARRVRLDDGVRERLERGAVVDGRFHDDDPLGQRVDPDDAEHLGVEGLPAERDEDDLEVIHVEHGGRAEASLEAAEHRSLVDEATVGERAHLAGHLDGRAVA